MMIMDIEVISMEMIKPSSPTPNHLRNYKLSLLDQLIPTPYAPIVLFYPNHDHASHFQVLERLDLLKKSLSETLTHFFPLAGTIKDDLSIDCDDQGARFTTAKVTKSSLNDFLETLDLKMIAQFLPCGVCVANIQANVFECGGIALAVCVSHKVLDGAALSNFLKSWANIGKSNAHSVVAPDFSASSLFPASDSCLKDASMAMWGSLFKKGEFVTRRFVFDGPSIAFLKNTVATHPVSGYSISPTRVEAVSGFIWKHAMAAYEARLGPIEQSLLTHLVNIRKRASPNFPDQAIGNLIWIASALACTGEAEADLCALVEGVKNSVSRVDGEYVNKLRGEDGWSKMKMCLKEIEELGRKNVHHLGFSSWCRLGFYDVDFGWGKPVWVGICDSSSSYFMNLAILIDSNCDDGIEAWVTMDAPEMDVLEHNQEFRALVSLNPSPLSIATAAV